MHGESDSVCKARVSIGLPVYNGAAYLRGALDALLCQTMSQFEIILSDNASTDETERICCEYAARDGRIRYIRQPRNLGALANFDYVLREATAEYFMWAAVDDLWNEEFLAGLCSVLDEHPEASGAQGEYTIIDENRKPLCALQRRTELSAASRKARLMTLARQRATNIYVYGLFRTRLLQGLALKPPPFARGYAQAAEYPILFYLASAGPLLTDTRACFSYRLHPSQESKRRHSLLVSIRLRLGLMVVLPGCVWKGSRSLPDSVLTSCAVWFYQTRAMVWQIARAVLGIQAPDKTIPEG